MNSVRPKLACSQKFRQKTQQRIKLVSQGVCIITVNLLTLYAVSRE